MFLNASSKSLYMIGRTLKQREGYQGNANIFVVYVSILAKKTIFSLHCSTKHQKVKIIATKVTVIKGQCKFHISFKVKIAKTKVDAEMVL